MIASHREIIVCVLSSRAAIYIFISLPPPPPYIKELLSLSCSFDIFLFIPSCLLWTLCWLGCSFFFFGFVVALVLCVKPAPEQQRLDDAIGFLRDHAEVRIAEFQFFSPFFIRSFFFHIFLRMLSLRRDPARRTLKRVHCTFCWLRFRIIMIIYCDKVFIVHNL